MKTIPKRPVGGMSVELVVSPVGRPGHFRAQLGHRELVTSRQPFLDSARVLLGEGCDPTTVLVMRHAGSPTESLRATIGAAAKLTVAEGELDPPRFRAWKPFLSREGSPQTRQNEVPATSPAIAMVLTGRRPSGTAHLAEAPYERSSEH
jgi:hypothetical protein